MANQSHLQRLSNPFFDWNEWRRIHKPTLDFMGAELFKLKSQQRDLSGGDFRSSIIDQTDFQLCDVSLSDFSRTRVTKSQLDKAKAHKTLLKKILVIQTSLQAVDFVECDFEHSSLQEVDLTSASIIASNLKFLTVTNSLFKRTIFSDCIIRKMSCSDTDFVSCDMKNLSLKRVEFHKISFQGSDLTDTSIVNSQLYNCTFTDANVSRMDFSGTRLDNVDFRQSYGFSHSILEHAFVGENVLLPLDDHVKTAENFTLNDEYGNENNIQDELSDNHDEAQKFVVEKNIKERAYSNDAYLRSLATDCLYYLKISLGHSFNNNHIKNTLNQICDYLEVISTATQEEFRDKEKSEDGHLIFEEIADSQSVQEITECMVKEIEKFLIKIDRDVSHSGRSDVLAIPGFLIILFPLCELAAALGEQKLLRKYYHIMGVIKS